MSYSWRIETRIVPRDPPPEIDPEDIARVGAIMAARFELVGEQLILDALIPPPPPPIDLDPSEYRWKDKGAP